MFKLKNLNVIRIVETEAEKAKLISQGFEDITPKQEETPPADDKAKQGGK